MLNLAQQRDQVTDEARVELDSEISTKGIGTAEMVSYARELLARQKALARRPSGLSTSMRQESRGSLEREIANLISALALRSSIQACGSFSGYRPSRSAHIESGAASEDGGIRAPEESSHSQN